MKVVWLAPPSTRKGYQNVGQSRFYKNLPIRTVTIYPYLAAMGITQLLNNGFEAEFYDCPTKSLTWESIQHHLTDADLIIMEGRTPIINDILQITDKLKTEHDRKIALYGDHVTWDPNTALNHADYVISGGDYDYGALKLAEALSKNNTPPKLFNMGLVENLDKLPFVDYESINWKDYYEAGRTRDTFLYTMSGRGCKFPCTFCSWCGTLWNHHVRQRTPLNVAEELRETYNHYGEYEILDDHDCFDTVWGVKFAKQLLQFGFTNQEIKWGIQTHSNFINDLEGLKLMKKAGLFWCKLGIESGNQETLDRMHKVATIEQHERAVKFLREADVLVHLNLMVGWPYETKKQAYHTIEWVKKLDPNQAQFTLVIPYPNTELYDEAKQNGWLTVGEQDWDSYDASYPMMKMIGMTPEEVVQLYNDCWRKFYLNRKYMMKHLLQIRTWHDIKILYRGFKSVYFGHMKAIKSRGEQN